MSASEISATLLTWVLVYGAAGLAVSLLIGAIGVPLPGTFLVMAAGAFVRQSVLDLPTVLIWALVGVLIGDAISFGLGRAARGPMLRRYGDTSAWRSATENMQRRGGWAIYLSRWLLTTLALPTNLAAGGGGYPFRRFMLFDAAGEVTWLLVYGGIGYFFSDQWETLSSLISDSSGALLGGVALLVGLAIWWRSRNQRAPVADTTPNP